ncbi:MAG: hypothetical protein EOP39_00170 [Rubrivivax sp.]|nr:MAG: hypothetical protein EOP39_00170 [Rubrivivax sp.]
MRAAAIALALLAAQAAAETKRFVSCPVYRDTVQGRKSGCWLATELESGQQFDLQQAHTKPQLGHEVLVEGELPPQGQRESNFCGAVLLKPVRVSVLSTPCPAVVLPAEGYPGKLFQLPGSVLTPNHLPQPMPAPPYRTQRLTLQFDLNDDYLLYQHAEVPLQQAARLARLGGAERVVVTGYAATVPTRVSAREIREDISVAGARARMVAEALKRLGVAPALLKVQWHGDPPPDEGAPPALREASKRRATVEVVIP